MIKPRDRECLEGQPSDVTLSTATGGTETPFRLEWLYRLIDIWRIQDGC
jgi:hypothetical protein